MISSFSSLPGLKYGTFFGGTSTLSPVFGLRPLRGSRLRRRKLPNPRSSIFSPAVQRVDDALEHRVDDDFRVLLREVGDARHFLHELRLGHAAARSIQWLLLDGGSCRPVLALTLIPPYRFLK